VPTTFADLGVPAPIVALLAEQGIETAFPIQEMTLADALAGRDLCGKAPTGSGKTIAFGIPMVAHVGQAQPRRPKGLVLVPTRELASQVRDELALLAGPRGRFIEAFYGGNGFGKQLNALRRGVDIAVACPGRLMDLLNRGDIKLDAVEFVVIDEADRMADMGFLPEVRKILDLTPKDRQTLLFSATLDGDIDVLVRHYQRHPVRHELAKDPADGARVSHYFWNVARDQRVSLCATIIAKSGPTIVFCRTKRGADRVARQLEQSGIRTAAIHGDRSQSQRERALEAFHRGDIEALIATDVAARGIHVDDVSAVVHLDPPADEKDYVHRSGRTGRAGAAGVVVTFVAPELRKDVTKMQKLLKMPAGITAPDPASLPTLDRPVRKARPAAPRHEDHDRSSRPGSPRRSSRPSGARSGSARRERDDRWNTEAPSSRSTSKPARSGQSSRPSKPAHASSAGGSGQPAKSGPTGSRKPRRAHVAGGSTAGAAGGAAGTRSRRSAGPNPDKGKRRQPSSGRG
jgi:superfamily II DNA/RNA helicase